ncbi:nuclear transport factor 2 family protein [Diaphorobacter sp. HDW4A]|uniref:nuclear transport factor 2 family protein n=1 Tax=Diaphorobacter sp. HDW4A TaxID=2714924 RepID=UPI001F10BFF1|nr:nuclear transport factor 2 family protein [Diaphorobacter sp. HDW4A]
MLKPAPSTIAQLLLEHALAQVLTRYATACDTRNHALLADVFTADCVTNYGGYTRNGLAAVQEMVSAHLDGCGPTQHLIGNLEVEASNDPQSARSKIHVRAIHKGLNERSALRYDAIGSYKDEWRLTPAGWRIHHRRFLMLLEIGDRMVLQPAG